MNKRLVAAGAAATTLAVSGGTVAIALTEGSANAATTTTTQKTSVLGTVYFDGFTLALNSLQVVNGQAIASGSLSVKVFGFQVALGSASLPFEVQLDGSAAAGYSILTPVVTVKTAIGTVKIPSLKIQIAGAGTPEAQVLQLASVAIHAAEAAGSLLAQVMGTSLQAVEQQVYNAAVTTLVQVIGQLNIKVAGHAVIAVVR